MSLIDYLKATNYNRQSYRPAMGKVLDENNNELDLTKMLLNSFDFDNGLLKTVDQDLFTLAGLGVIPGVGTEYKFGRSSAITTTESVIWDGGGNYTFLTVAEQMRVVSTNAGDNIAGAGAKLLVIYGLDANYNQIVEIVEMNGLTPVITTNSFLRVYRALVLTSGTNTPIGDANLGDITIIGNTSTTLQAKILQHNGQTAMLVYTVPAGKTALVYGVTYGVGQGKQCTFRSKVRNGDTSDYAFTIKGIVDLYQQTFIGPFKSAVVIPEKTDICVTGQTTQGTVDAITDMELILIDN